MAGGGPRTPANPAPVSGPGALSRRTDGQPTRDVTGLPYGDNAELRSQQGAAPMSGSNPATSQGAAGPQVPLTQMSPNMMDPTNHPDRSVFNGMPFGPGAGPEALGSAEPSPITKQKLLNALPTLLRAAESPDVSPEFRRMVAMIRSGTLG